MLVFPDCIWAVVHKSHAHKDPGKLYNQNESWNPYPAELFGVAKNWVKYIPPKLEGEFRLQKMDPSTTQPQNTESEKLKS